MSVSCSSPSEQNTIHSAGVWGRKVKERQYLHCTHIGEDTKAYAQRQAQHWKISTYLDLPPYTLLQRNVHFAADVVVIIIVVVGGVPCQFRHSGTFWHNMDRLFAWLKLISCQLGLNPSGALFYKNTTRPPPIHSMNVH